MPFATLILHYVVCDAFRLEENPQRYHFAERMFGSIPEIIFTFRATPFLAQSGHTLVLGDPAADCIPFEGPLESVHAQDGISDEFWVRLVGEGGEGGDRERVWVVIGWCACWWRWSVFTPLNRVAASA